MLFALDVIKRLACCLSALYVFNFVESTSNALTLVAVGYRPNASRINVGVYRGFRWNVVSAERESASQARPTDAECSVLPGTPPASPAAQQAKGNILHNLFASLTPLMIRLQLGIRDTLLQ